MASTREKMSREQYRQAQELDKARKAGQVPAAVDVETGKEINPHIPHYIAQTPWYYNTTGQTLIHQHSTLKKPLDINAEWYTRGARYDTQPTKYRKGACENCGSMTHKAKECTERPRKYGAKLTGKDIKADEVVQDIQLDWDSKRDRWNGYDANEYLKQVEEWEKIEEKHKELKSNKFFSEVGKKDADEEEKDEDKYAEDADMAGQKLDLKTRTTIRNLRIREDTAKYLLNLDVNSAYYDPKTRSMRDNPFKDQGIDPSETLYGGDNFVRYSGDAPAMAQLQLFAWNAQEKGTDVNLQADPTHTELLNRDFKKRKETLESTQADSILEKYGGEEYLKPPPKELLYAQSDQYVEYSRTGRVIKGQDKGVIRSKYLEDIHPNNHSSIWGSYWEDGRWGYKCCHQFVKNSICTKSVTTTSSSTQETNA